VNKQSRSTYVITDPSEILRALVGLKGVRILQLARHGPEVEPLVEQVFDRVCCASCGTPARVKERPVVRYVVLPVYGTPMRLAWQKHRMRCVDPGCPTKSWVLVHHRIAARGCLLTTRAAKWATVQVGIGRTVAQVAGELDCDWHTVNDAVTTDGRALLAADKKRPNKTTAIGLDKTSFVRLGTSHARDYATTVAHVEHHQIIEILPSAAALDEAMVWGPSRWLPRSPRTVRESPGQLGRSCGDGHPRPRFAASSTHQTGGSTNV